MEKGDFVIVETSIGEQYTEVVSPNKEIPESKLTAPLKPIIRKANLKDKSHEISEQWREKQDENKPTVGVEEIASISFFDR